MATRSPRCAPCVLALALGVMAVGCAGISRPSDLRPASHPLLEGVASRTRLLPLSDRAPERERRERRATRPAAPAKPPATARPAPTPRPGATSPDRPSTRDALVRRMDALAGSRRIADRPATDMGLLRAVFDTVDGVREPGETVSSARRAGRAVTRPRPGDVAFFDGAGGAAEVALVHRLRDDGAIEALAVTRGAVRPIVVHPDDPHARRRAGRIVNTFLRTRRPDDEASAVYLAGQLLIDFRTLLD